MRTLWLAGDLVRGQVRTGPDSAGKYKILRWLLAKVVGMSCLRRCMESPHGVTGMRARRGPRSFFPAFYFTRRVKHLGSSEASK